MKAQAAVDCSFLSQRRPQHFHYTLSHKKCSRRQPLHYSWSTRLHFSTVDVNQTAVFYLVDVRCSWTLSMTIYTALFITPQIHGLTTVQEDQGITPPTYSYLAPKLVYCYMTYQTPFWLKVISVPWLRRSDLDPKILSPSAKILLDNQ